MIDVDFTLFPKKDFFYFKEFYFLTFEKEFFLVDKLQNICFH